jgi:hypothetical protein
MVVGVMVSVLATGPVSQVQIQLRAIKIFNMPSFGGCVAGIFNML